jgi:hypothetical protein
MTDQELLDQILHRGHKYANQQSDVRLRKFARHVRDKEHLVRLMNQVEDVSLRASLTDRLRPLVKD